MRDLKANKMETITRLSRVGFDNVLGYLNGGISFWEQDGGKLNTINSISPDKFESIYSDNNNIDVVDVRKIAEYLSEHLIDANTAPLSMLEENLNQFSAESENFVHCAGGYRSVIACSILKRKGFHNITNIEGGFSAMKELNINISDFVCPSTL